MPHIPGLGAIYGIVAENGNPVEGAKVRLLDRSPASGPVFLRTGITAEDGGFVFSGLNTETDDYMIFVTDETGGTTEDPYKNALIQDRIKPVPVHVGEHYPSSWVSKFKAMNPALLYPAPFIDPRFDLINGAQFSGTANTAGRDSGGAISYTDAAPFVETAFNLPTVKLIDSTWLNMQGSYQHTLGHNTISRFAMFAVVDFSEDWGFTQLVHTSSSSSYDSATSGYRAVSPLIVVAFNGSDTIRVELCSAYYNHWDTGVYTFAPFSILKTYNTVLSSPPAGFESVGVSFRNGGEVWLYVGETAYLLDNTTVPVKFTGSLVEYDQNLYVANGGFHGWNRAGATSGSQRMALYMFSPYYMDHAKFLELRDALITPQFPNETGYAREVTVDCPSALYMMDERNPGNNFFLEHYIGDTTGHSPSLIQNTQAKELRIVPGHTFSMTTSPLAGRAACVFTGASCLYNIDGAGVNYRNFTLSGWLNQTSRSATQYVMALQNSTTDTAARQFDLSINSSGKLSLFLAGTNEAKVFAETMPLNEWYHFAVVLNKSAEAVSLYVNGVFSESIQVSTTAIPYDQLTNGNIWSPVQRALVIGGRLNGTTTTSGFIGAMCGLAIFPYPLLSYRIAEHYAAKDIV